MLQPFMPGISWQFKWVSTTMTLYKKKVGRKVDVSRKWIRPYVRSLSFLRSRGRMMILLFFAPQKFSESLCHHQAMSFSRAEHVCSLFLSSSLSLAWRTPRLVFLPRTFSLYLVLKCGTFFLLCPAPSSFFFPNLHVSFFICVLF